MNAVQSIAIKEQTFSIFEQQLEAYQKHLNSVKNGLELKSCILLEFNTFVDAFINLGNQTSDVDFDPQYTHMVNYVLSEDFKTLIILHRDVFLELSKVSISNQERQLSENQIENHFKNSKEILEKILEDFYRSIELKKEKLTTNKKTIEKISRTITLQKNPWEIYKSQFDTIISQIKSIDTQKTLAFKSVEIFNELKTSVIEVASKHKELIKKIAENVRTISEKTKENKNYETLFSLVDEQISQQAVIENKQFLFSEIINNHINQLQNIEIPIHTIDGLLSVRDIDLKKRTQKWFDYQILPEFMDLIGLETSLINKYSLNLMNLKNSLQLAKDKPEDTKFNSILNTLTHLEDEIKAIETKGEAISNSLKSKVKNELLITNLIKEKPFLDVTLNSSLNVESNTLLKKIKEKFHKGSLYFNSQYQKSINYESLSNMELSTQCIAHRMYQDESTHYDSLFLNKKFIGDLFLVPRQTQEDKLEGIVELWNQGFNKSVLVTGNRLSGRSTFLNYSAKKFFGKDIVNLSPNSDATIDGRKFKTTNDLKEVLLYVKNNNTKSTRPVVLIDDLELWRDSKHSLLYNIRALINFIETESDDALVLASTTNMMANHLDKRLNFTNTFSHSINVDEAEKEEIINAVLLRHGAAHRDLIAEDLEIIPDHKLRILAYKLSKRNGFNLGETLQSWTHYTFVQDNEKVLFKESYYEFLDFFTAQETIILKQALIFRYISEYSIKSTTTTAFDTDFKSALRRLMNVKVLLRDINGYLFINPVIVNDVSRIINTKTNL